MNTCVTHLPADTPTEQEEQHRELEQRLNQLLCAPKWHSAEPRTWTIYWRRLDEE